MGDAGNAESSATPQQVRPIDLVEVRAAKLTDVTGALRAGIADFFKRPMLSAFFGLVYAVFGIAFLSGVMIYDQIWMVVFAGVGFPLVAPFLAAGLYEMSRRYQNGIDFSPGEIFSIIFQQQRREFGWMAFVTLFIFWVWVYQVRLWLAIFLQWQSFSTFEGFVGIVTSTPEGWGFLTVGTLVGAALATWLFSVTVTAMPMLLDREIDFVSAMLLSIKAVLASPVIMLGWGTVIAVSVFVAMLPAFIGLVFVLPVLGHTTWHLYKNVIIEKE